MIICPEDARRGQGRPAPSLADLLTRNCTMRRLRGFLLSGGWGEGARFFYFLPHLSAPFRIFPLARAILPGDRELAEAVRSRLGRARRAEECHFMGTTIYTCYTYCQGKKCAEGWGFRAAGRKWLGKTQRTSSRRPVCSQASKRLSSRRFPPAHDVVPRRESANPRKTRHVMG